MSLHDLLIYGAAALLVAGMLYLPRKIGRRRRLIAGLILFVVGWAGILGGLALDGLPFFQSESVAFAWVGAFSAATVLSVVLLIPACFEWAKARRPRLSRRERRPNGL